MTPTKLFLLVAGGTLFALWAFLMFRTLFRLRKRGVAASGQMFPGVGQTLVQWRIWLTSPEDRRDRRWLGLTTLALFLWNGLGAWAAG